MTDRDDDWRGVAMPIDDLRRLMRLDPETGKLFWLPRGEEWFPAGKYSSRRNCAIWNTKNAGNEALTSNVEGYKHGRILGVNYRAHRVVFALYHGRWPSHQIDHIDGNRSNNHPKNLREATNQQNCYNVGSKGGTSRFCGVSRAARGKWQASAKGPGGGSRHLGFYITEEDAARAYDAAVLKWRGEFARLNFPEVEHVQK